MAVLASTDISFPKDVAAGIWKKTQTGSVVSQLSGAEPLKFGETDIFTFDTFPRAEYVAEGADKSPSSAAFGVKTVKPHKVQVTVRYDQEVQWADEDTQVGVLTELGDSLSIALARALDLGAIHGINPLTGAAATTITESLTGVTNIVTIGTDADLDVESAVGLVVADEFTPNGIAFDPKYAWTLATARYTDGRKKYPELGFGTDITNFGGLPASVSTTVSGLPEAAADTKVRGIVGDWTTLRWGVQRNIGLTKILYGDPDGLGDLSRKNQIALRAEVVYGWAFLDLNAFALLKVAGE
jgi:HK97 family phage major capsid protein